MTDLTNRALDHPLEFVRPSSILGCTSSAAVFLMGDHFEGAMAYRPDASRVPRRSFRGSREELDEEAASVCADGDNNNERGAREREAIMTFIGKYHRE